MQISMDTMGPPEFYGDVVHFHLQSFASWTILQNKIQFRVRINIPHAK